MSVREQIADTVARIAADHCPVAVTRQAEDGVAQRAGPGGEGAWVAALLGIGGDDVPATVPAGAACRPADDLWRELVAAGLDRATAAGSVGGAGLAWADVFPLLRAVGEFAMPVPLAETLGAHALAAAAGCVLSGPGGGPVSGAGWQAGELPLKPLAGAASFGRLLREGGRLVAPSVAWGDRIETVVGVDERGEVRLLAASDALREDTCNQAGEVRSRMSWPASTPVSGEVDPAAPAILGAALHSARLAGAMGTVLAMTVRHAGEREQFGRPIGRFQAVQQQMALMAELAVQATVAAELACEGAGPLPDPVRAACAKQVGSANALQCAAIAHAVHGAIGITAEHSLQLFTRRLRAWAAEWGGAHHWAMMLGRHLLAGPQASVWHAVIEASAGPADSRPD